MMKYVVLLSLLFGLVSCNNSNKPASEKKENKKVETSKQVPVKRNNQVAQIGIDKNLIRLATQNRDSVRLSQKARLDTLMKDPGKRYAIQDAMGKFKKGMEFNLFFDSDTIYLKRIYKSLKDETFGEVARPFREMAKKEKLKPEDVAEEIKKYRKKG